MKRWALALICVLVVSLILGVSGCGCPPNCKTNSISWDQAKYHIGERTTVSGPVISTNYATNTNGQPTFLDIGRAYPDSNRFEVLIWGNNRHNFGFAPESYYRGKSICVTGLIQEYNGVAEIEVSTPSQIQVQ
jgi:DNA/RNA endonuclease YhcR with UshA esterase domain